ncbi:DNA-processing protein DprA [Vampirovibrio chlorellavorus]|uniref:DNA-processing protein DprA n=1 Tax=Vampirovibrio chlorellavorus TaxID=758823 RepID=UPI0026EADCD9|nr:DNA-processing protein DprA [Vampirovibrio chlorellavorus]
MSLIPPTEIPSITSVPQAPYPDAVYLRALLEVDGLGNLSILKLLRAFESPEALWNAPEAQLALHLGASKLAAFLKRRDEGLPITLHQRERSEGIQAVAITEKAYPALLKEIYNPPVLLYVKGRLEAFSGRCLAFVGTRKSSEYGRKVTGKLIQELRSTGVAIVSGLAAGIDTCAHWQAIQCSLPTVAVFGCGLDILYPASNRMLAQEILEAGGAWVSEYPPGTQPTRYSFPQRNRIVAGLCQGIVVVEGDIKSGALITARLAAEEGRSVYAVPGNIFSSGSQGPHELLKTGATLVNKGSELLTDLGWDTPHTDGMMRHSQPQVASLPELSEEEGRLLQAIAYDPMGIDDLPRATGYASAKINELLTLLELEGLIVLLPGAKVCRK